LIWPPSGFGGGGVRGGARNEKKGVRLVVREGKTEDEIEQGREKKESNPRGEKKKSRRVKKEKESFLSCMRLKRKKNRSSKNFKEGLTYAHRTTKVENL